MTVYIVGLIILSVAVGVEAPETVGFMVFGVGLIWAGMMHTMLK